MAWIEYPKTSFNPDYFRHVSDHCLVQIYRKMGNVYLINGTTLFSINAVVKNSASIVPSKISIYICPKPLNAPYTYKNVLKEDVLVYLLWLRLFSCWLVGWFCCFTSQVNSYGHCGTVSSPNHTFSWAGLNKRLTSNSCTYFRL